MEKWLDTVGAAVQRAGTAVCAARRAAIGVCTLNVEDNEPHIVVSTPTISTRKPRWHPTCVKSAQARASRAFFIFNNNTVGYPLVVHRSHLHSGASLNRTSLEHDMKVRLRGKWTSSSLSL